MNKIAKIYCSKKDLTAVAPSASLIESYEAFQLVEISPAAFKRTANVTPVEDVTKLYRVKVGGRSVDTNRPRYNTKGKMLAHPAYKNSRRLPKGPHHYLVQFVGPIKQAWLRQVSKAGGIARDPFRDFAYIFQLDARALKTVTSLPFVRWVGHLPDESRIAPGVFTRSKGRERTGPLDLGGRSRILPELLTLQFFDANALTKALPAVRKAGAKVILMEKKAKTVVVKVPSKESRRKQVVKTLSAVHGVRLITAKVARSTRNNVAVGFMGTKSVISAPPNGLGLTGKGEIIGVADTGLDTGDPQTVLPDFRGRVLKIFSWPIDPSIDPYVTNPGADDGPADVDSGHGTHTSGSVLGGGSQGPGNAPAIRGLSYEAQLVFQAIEQKMAYVSADAAAQFGDAEYALTGIPSDLNKLFQQAYELGARIHSNSWGGGKPGEYADDSRQVDEFVWNNRDFCILIAAGNDGKDPNPGADGVIDEGSVTPPGTAKNCITVGASESVRAEFKNLKYGGPAPWKKDFPKEPIKSDPVANNPDDMAAFSSRGPTADNRVKPEVVAPGTAILSTRSSRLADTEEGWGAYPSNPNYMFDGGTSMGTPLTAGAVGLIRQYFRKVKNVAVPSAALLKATLICGAQRMPLTYVPGKIIFDNHQGFGRVNLENVLLSPGDPRLGFFDAAPGLQTGGLSETTIQIPAGSKRLRVALAYTDYPGHALKNNLNLMGIAPDGSRQVGNADVGSNTLVFDSKNNVEVCEISNPSTGTWRFRVIAANVPQGPQPFALVWLVG
jgi:serine protease AprX